MKHQVKVKVKTKETGLFGIKHDVIREQYVASGEMVVITGGRRNTAHPRRMKSLPRI